MSWCTAELPPLDRAYHDAEWGIPLHDDRRQFEYVSLEVMQCGLSWSLMLKRRAVFRRHDVQFNFIETGTVFVKDGRSYRIPDKRVQSRQAALSGLSVPGRPVHYKLRHPEGSLFNEPVVRTTGHFRDTCASCGSRMTCNGCSDCGACDEKKTPSK